MDVEFHYWITGIIAGAAGMSHQDAAVLAYSCQYVDDNTIGIIVRDKKTGGGFGNLISQTINILKPRNHLMRIYPMFHFVPGDPLCDQARRRDGKMHMLTTTPDNVISRQLVEAAKVSPGNTRLYRLGIALHAHSDTWAHQNFVGWYDEMNAMGKISPNIGHADAGFDPDEVNGAWHDDRLVRKAVKNNERFLGAAESVFTFLAAYTGNPVRQWIDLKAELLALMTSSHKPDKRIDSYRKSAPWLPAYDEFQWLNEAVRPAVPLLGKVTNKFFLGLGIMKERFVWRNEGYGESHWYLFQNAVKEHCREALVSLKPVFDQMDVDISVS